MPMSPKVFILLAALAAPAAAAERGASPFVTPALREGLAEIRAAAPRWEHVNLRVRSGQSSFLEVAESRLGVSLNGNQDSSGYLRFHGTVQGKFLSYTASPSYGKPAQGYTLWGSGAHITLSRQGGERWQASGSLDGKTVNFSISRWASGGYNLWGLNGMNLQGHASGDMVYVNGSVDLSRSGAKELAVLGVALAVAHAAPSDPGSAAQGEAVKAAWRAYAYDGPRRRHPYECVPALHAVNDVLSLMEARVRRKHCSGYNGLVAEWESLVPVEAPASAAAAAAPGQAVDAAWVRGTLQVSLADPHGCWVYSETLDYLLDMLPVKKPSQTVFCQQGQSFISVSFDYLAPAGATRSGPRVLRSRVEPPAP